ncbi:MAG: hypothetical protein RSB39_00320 [Oscillospiraceae bacterium]
MNEQKTLRYFLGANTASGFFSLYDSFVSLDEGDFLWIIKGGPGCGKSSFMKMLGAAAERAGLLVEYAMCSGDPASLDGVYIPALKTAYMDGTAPHIADARITAVDSAYLDLGVFYDISAISEYRPELNLLRKSTGALHKKAYTLLHAEGVLRRDWQNSFISDAEKKSATKRINGIIAREFGRKSAEAGTIKRRFLSALSCQGRISLIETAQTLCKRFYLFDDNLGLSALMLDKIAQGAIRAGHDIIICPDPLLPENTEAVLVPSLSLGFVGTTLSEIPKARRIRLDNAFGIEKLRSLKPELRRCERLCEALQSEALSALAESKKQHDSIEAIYNPNVDFDGVYALVRSHMAALGLK